jgi:pyruvyl transferase EpsI
METIFNQTYENFIVIIVVEAGCTDNTASLCEEYAARDNRIRVYHNEKHLGIAGSLNRGLDYCEGDYIARADVDDPSFPERLEKQVAYMETHPEVGICGSWHRNFGPNWENIQELPEEHEDICAYFIFDQPFCHSSLLLRRSFFEGNHYRYPDTLLEDYPLWVSLMDKTKMHNLPQALVNRHFHAENISTMKSNKVFSEFLDDIKETISNTLRIDVSRYSEIHFTFRDYPSIYAHETERVLCEAAALLREILEANRRLCRFDESALRKVLEKRWRSAKIAASLDGFLAEVPFDTPTTTLHRMVNEANQKFNEIYEGGARVVIYAVGALCVNWFKRFDEEGFSEYPFRLLAFCDANPQKQGTAFLGKEVISPERLSGLDYDYILISSPLIAEEVIASLTKVYSIPREKILKLNVFNTDNLYHLKIYSKSFPRQESRRAGENKAYLFCAPDYGNLGDHAIASAENEFFCQRFAIKLAEIECSKFDELLPHLRRHIAPHELVLVTGGGFLGSLWEVMEFQVRKVVETFHENSIIILPQTLFWEDARHWAIEREKTAEIYAGHPDLTLCARDKETFRLMREIYPTCRVLLVPDMVLIRDWHGFFKDAAKREGTLLCLKMDKESILANSDFETLEAIGAELCGGAFECGTNLSDQAVYSFERDDYLREKMAEFRSAKLVITDRLHGLIFAVMTSTPCVALNNFSHKLRASFGWVEYLPYVRFADSVDQVEGLAEEALAAVPGKYDITPLLPYFDELEYLIREKIEGDNI